MLGAPGTGSWILLLFSLFFFRLTTGKATNRTIDDQFGDSVTGQKPIFSPTTDGIWADETCGGCRFQPDKAVAFKGTWHAATFRPEQPGGSGPLAIDLSFKGTAIYIYFITGNQIAGGIITTLMECNFTLDGEHAGFYQHIPDKSEDFQYNVLAFNSTGLRNVDHTVRVTTEGVNYHLLLNFDYAIYTFDDTPDPATNTSASSSTLPPFDPAAPSNTPPLLDPTTPSGTSSANTSGQNGDKTPLGAIIGGTLGGLAAILVLIALLYIYRDKKRRNKPSELPLHTNMATYSTIAPSTKAMPRRSRIFTQIFPQRSSKDRDRKSLRQSINPSGLNSESPSSDYPSSPDNIIAGGNPTSTNYQSNSSSLGEAHRARRIQLEAQLRAAEQELREMGVEPQRGPPGPNVPPAMLQTSVYIEYRRLQGEMEEPPPQYSE